MLRAAGRRPAAPGAAGPARPRRWALLAALGTGVTGCVIVLAGGMPAGGASPPGSRPVSAFAAGLVRVLPAGNRVAGRFSLPEVNDLAGGLGSLWLTGGYDGQNHVLYAVNPVTSRIAATVALPSLRITNPGDLATGAGAVWVAVGDHVYRVVPGRSGRAVTRPFATLPRGGLIGDIATGAGAVWVDDTTRGMVYRYAACPAGGGAACTGRPEAAVRVGRTAGVMAVGDGGLWVADPDARTVSRISLARNRVDAVVTLPGAPAHLAAAGGALWVTDGTGDVTVIGAGGQTRSVPLGGQPTGLAAAGGTVWVANTAHGTLSRIDARRGVVEATIGVGQRPYAVAADAQGVWVAVLGQPMMARIVPSAAARGGGNLGWLLRLCGQA